MNNIPATSAPPTATATAASPLPALLQQANDGLRQADDTMLQGDLEGMLVALHGTLDALAALAHLGQVAVSDARDPTQAPKPAWDGQRLEAAVWQLLARLHQAGCGAFPFAGTLLGLERDGRLLPGDKDADFGVWLDDYSLALRALQAMGLQRAGNVPPFGNMACLVEPQSGLSVDLFGIRREPEHRRLVGGVWLYGRPPSHQRISHYPWFELVARPGPAGPVWWPGDADALLTAQYGDWRTPRPEWDSVVSSRALQDINLHWRCFALKNLAERWLTGDAARTRRLLDSIGARAGWDAPLARWRDALEALKALSAGTPPNPGQGSA